MPSLRVMIPGRGLKVFRLYKAITTIGRGAENDLTLPDARLADVHAHVQFDGREFHVTSLDVEGDLHINEKRKKKHKLQHEDVIKIGATELLFSVFDEGVVSEGETDAHAAAVTAA